MADGAPKSVLGMVVGWMVIGAVLAVLVAAIVRREPAPPPRPEPARRSLPPALVKPEPSATTARPDEPPAPTPDVGNPDAADVGASEGCGSKPPFHGFGRLHASRGFGTESWPAYIPEGYSPTRQTVLLMLFHDDAQKGAAFARLSGFVEIADQLGFVIVAPEDSRLMAWPDKADAEVGVRAAERAAELLCIDRSRIFAVGYGAGGRVVEELPCRMDIAGIATASFRSTVNDDTCVPEHPVPYLHLAPLHDGYTPVEGGRGCGGLHEPISLAAKEAMWRKRNHCSSKKRVFRENGGSKCTVWSCGETPFASCHIDGGRGWPGSGHRIFDINRCDGEPPRFPYAETIWKFFARPPL